jgi:hypothetical protein
VIVPQLQTTNSASDPNAEGQGRKPRAPYFVIHPADLV